jgi:hypothetical protein
MAWKNIDDRRSAAAFSLRFLRKKRYSLPCIAALTPSTNLQVVAADLWPYTQFWSGIKKVGVAVCMNNVVRQSWSFELLNANVFSARGDRAG